MMIIMAMFVGVVLLEKTNGMVQKVNFSLSTLPVAYFGGIHPRRPQANIEMLGKQRLTMIDTWEGPCWPACFANASAGLPCDTSCGQEAYIIDTLTRVRALNSGTALGFYQNSLFAWAFQFFTGRVRSENGLLHATNGSVVGLTNDAGMPDTPVFDLSQDSIVDMWLDHERNLSMSGVVDGSFVDKPNVHCIFNDSVSSYEICEGPDGPMENHPWSLSCALVPTPVAVAFNKGKERLLAEVQTVWDNAGGFTLSTQNSSIGFYYSWDKQSVETLQKGVQQRMASSTANAVYLMSADQHNHDPNDLSPICTNYTIALAMTVLEEGVLVGCNGWCDDFEKPLGDPLGPVKKTGPSIYERTFSSGTHVILDEAKKTANISWIAHNQKI